MPAFVTCVPTEGLTASVAPCVDVGGVPTSPVVMELAAPGSITFANSDLLFSYGLKAVVTCWLVGLAVGLILSLVKRAG